MEASGFFFVTVLVFGLEDPLDDSAFFVTGFETFFTTGADYMWDDEINNSTWA